jgi:hexosaminidase
MLNTVWNDDGEGIFDENWFGVLFGAAAGWQPGESSEDAFTASYGLAFHGDAFRQNRPGAASHHGRARAA